MRNILTTLLTLALLVSTPLLLGREPDAMDPDDLQDPALQRELVRIIDANGWNRLTDANRMAVTLVILGEEPPFRLAGINAHSMLYAASLPKIAILLAAMVSAQEGELEIDAGLEQDLHDMIRLSCNPCATRAMERVGRDRILEILQRPEFGFYDPQLYGGLWVGKDYGPATAHRRDPVHGLSHGATTFQVAHLYYELATGTLLQPEYARRMLESLAEPGISHKFVAALENEQGLKMWRKSGTWKDFHADSALVESNDSRYIIVAIVQAIEGEQILRRLAREVHEIVQDLPVTPVSG
jgi:beta-lactamase class A